MNYVPLGQVADIQLGKMLSPKAKTGKDSFHYLRNQNVQWGKILLENLATMDFPPREQAKFELKPGDLLVCEGGEPGRCAVWTGEITNCFYQKALHRVRPHRGVADSEFLSFWIRYQAFRGSFEDQNAKTTIAHLPLVRLEQLPVPDISLDRQRKTANRLSAMFEMVDDARRAVRKQIDELASLANAIVRSSLANTVETYPLGSVLEEVRLGVGSGWADYPVLGATRDGLAPAKDPVGKNPSRYKLVLPGTVFYNPMRILIGSVAMVDELDTPGITSPDYVALRGRPEVLDSRWFYYWLRSHEGARCIASLARGAVRERMLFNRLAEGEIDLPPYKVQQAGSRTLAELRPLKARIQTQLREIESLPGRLLAQVFQE